MTQRRHLRLSFVVAILCFGPTAIAGAAPAQTCTVTSIRGTPISGVVCGGTTHGLNCTSGAIYRCRNNTNVNNCSLQQACPVGCKTGPNTGTLADVCFSGAAPLRLSTTRTLGGNDVGLTVTLADAHPAGAEINLRIDRGDLVPGSYCGVPDLGAGANQVTFALPSAVVSASAAVTFSVDVAYSDGGGVSRQLASVPSVLTLDPGGTEPPTPAIASFTLTPSTIAPGGVSFMDVVLERMAPARGVDVAVTSSDPSVASVITNGQPIIGGGCTTGGGAATVQAASSVAHTTTVAISAVSGAPGEVPVSNPLTVTGGCTPRTCLEARGGTVHGGPCGSLPDGCGGTISCGCDFGETCGGGGTAGQCGTAPSLAVSGLSLNPSTVTGGSSSTATVTLNMPAPAGGAAVFLSSSSAAAHVPQSVVVPGGQTSATFVVTTTTVGSSTLTTITAQLGGTVSAVLTVNPAAGCSPTTCAAQGKNCGSISNGCGGTLSCGSCTAPQTCGGGGVANVCGGGGTTSTAPLSVTATGRSGESISSTPAGLRVNVGSTGSASFAVGTSVTLSVSNGRDAIWSGGCSSGGSKTKTCALTVNAATSVTANVQ